jgi:hypothetical protein
MEFTTFRPARRGHLSVRIGGGPVVLRPPTPVAARPQALPGFSRLVPSGSPGGPARVPNVVTHRNFGSEEAYLRAAEIAGRLARLAKGASRINPYVSGALTALDLLDGISQSSEVPWETLFLRTKEGVTGYTVPTGWEQCPNPSWGGSCGARPPPQSWNWFQAQNTVGTCTIGGACPTLQFHSGDDPLGVTTDFPANTSSIVFLRPTPSNPSRRDFVAHFRRTTPYLGGTQTYPSYGTSSASYVPAANMNPLTRVRSLAISRMPSGGEIVAPFARANTAPAIQTISGGRGPIGPKVKVDHEMSRVPVREPEQKKKLFLGPGARRAARVYGALTEVGDALDCLSKAAPSNAYWVHTKGAGGHLQKGVDKHPGAHGPLHERAMALLEPVLNNQIDWGKFGTCLGRETFKDLVIGKLSRAGAVSYGRQVERGYAPKRPVGPGFGSFSQRMPGMQVKTGLEPQSVGDLIGLPEIGGYF